MSRSKYILFFLILLVASSCSKQNDQFTLEAQFKNLNQGEFYIYDYYTGEKDTIAVNDGRFVYKRQLTDTLTLSIIFPNYSEIPVFATPGGEVTMEGDASHLRDTELKGTPDNELMTAFRLKTNEMTPPEAEAEAEKVINEHPESPVSLYLLQKYFLQSLTPDYAKAYTLCEKLRNKLPYDQHVARLLTQLEALKNYTADGQQPEFTAISTNGDTISNTKLRSDVNVILVWATWSFDSHSPMRSLKNLQKIFPERRLKIVSICVDDAPSEGEGILERDSITWPNVCDSMMFQSPLLAQLGIATLPANIISDKQGNIVARNLANSDLENKVKQLLGGLAPSQPTALESARHQN